MKIVCARVRRLKTQKIEEYLAAHTDEYVLFLRKGATTLERMLLSSLCS